MDGRLRNKGGATDRRTTDRRTTAEEMCDRLTDIRIKGKNRMTGNDKAVYICL